MFRVCVTRLQFFKCLIFISTIYLANFTTAVGTPSEATDSTSKFDNNAVYIIVVVVVIFVLVIVIVLLVSYCQMRNSEHRRPLQPNPLQLQPQILQPQILQPQILQPQILQPQILQPQILQPLQLQRNPQVTPKEMASKQGYAKTLHIDLAVKYNESFGIERILPKQPIVNKESSSKSSWWEIPAEALKIYRNTVLGSGQFGVIILGGVFRNGQEKKCAIKTVKENASAGQKRSLKVELQNMANMDPHPNIVNLIGAQTVNDKYLVVVEFCENGDLYNYLKKRQNEKRWADDPGGGTTIQYMARIRMAFDTANGMNYLAVKGFIHRDLAARNVLLDGELRAKVSDFGRARDVGETKRIFDSTRVKNEPIPTRWMPIETLQHQIFSSKSDVWSFGVLLWEIESGGIRPYNNEQTYRQVVDKVVYQGYRLEQPSQCPDEIYEIMIRCWKIDPDERPSFRELAENLGELLKANLMAQ